MNFEVGSHTYRLRMMEHPIVLKGVECLGVCRQRPREVRMSPACKEHERLGVLAHELVHAWVFETGEPSTLEGWCDLLGSCAAGLLHDLSMQGGVDALKRLRPGESPQPAAARIGLLRARNCGKCKSAVAGGSVLCTTSNTPGILDLCLYCDFCGHLQQWQEAATMGGLPSGVPVGDGRFEEDREIVAQFLHDHPTLFPAEDFSVA